MIRELLDEFPILGWRTYILTCMTDIISERKNSAIMNTGDTRDLYYYGMPGVEHDQDLFSTKFTNTRGMFLTSALRNVLETSSWFIIKRNNMAADPYGQDQIMNLLSDTLLTFSIKCS